MIKIEHMSFGYGFRKNLYEDFSLSIPDGARICFAGSSGSGKSTLLRLLLGLETPRRGEITGISPLLRSVVFQEDRLIPHMTVLENVSLFAGEKTPCRDDAGLSRGETASFAYSVSPSEQQGPALSSPASILTSLGLAEYLAAYPSELSGGMKRRVCLARALAHPYDLLVLDEAFTGLDDAAKQLCFHAVNHSLDESPGSRILLMAAHDPAEAKALGAAITRIDTAQK